jgi:hypothetical protein
MKFDLDDVKKISETVMAVAIAVMLSAVAIILSVGAGYLIYNLFT